MTIASARLAACAALLAAASAPLAAQPDETAAAVPQAAAGVAPEATVSEELPPAPGCCLVPARTVVEIEIVDRLHSRLSATRQGFALRLAEPLVVDGRVVAPAGTPGVGEVVHAARARAGGKAGELILAARYLDLDGSRIMLRSLRYGPSQGLDNSGAVNVGAMVTAAVIPVASVLGYLVAGGEVDIPAGTRAHAMTSADIRLAPLDSAGASSSQGE